METLRNRSSLCYLAAALKGLFLARCGGNPHCYSGAEIVFCMQWDVYTLSSFPDDRLYGFILRLDQAIKSEIRLIPAILRQGLKWIRKAKLPKSEA